MVILYILHILYDIFTDSVLVSCYPESSPPQNVTVSQIMSTSALISWLEPTNPNGDIQFYNLTIASAGGGVVIIGGVTNTLSLVILNPFTAYTVTVRAVHVIDGEMSVPVSFTTDEDSKPFVSILRILITFAMFELSH